MEKNIWYSTIWEAKGQVDRRGDQKCQKTARDLNMKKTGITPENPGTTN